MNHAYMRSGARRSCRWSRGVTVAEVLERLQGTVLAGEAGLGRVVGGGYASDLLSDVIANTREGDVWLTLQRHVNVVAVAQLKQLAAVVLVNDRRLEPDAETRARGMGIPIVSTPLSTFDAAGALFGLGLHGSGPR